MTPDTELSAEATVVLAHCTEQSTPLAVKRLGTDSGVPGGQLAESLDELMSAGRLGVAEDNILRVLPRPTEHVRALAPRDRADVEADERYHWRLGQLVQGQRSEPDSMMPLHGLQATHDRIEAAFRSTPRECLSLSPQASPALVAVCEPDHRAPVIDMLSKGTANVWISDSSALQNRQMRQHMTILAGYGEKIYTAPRVTQRLFVFDRRIAFVPLDPSDQSKGAMMIRSAEVAGVVVSLFHELLARSTRFAPTAPNPLVHKDVLVLMAQGAKDEAIGRRLGISARTVRRSVADMLELSGADSRFQLAIAAVRLGWLDPDDLAMPRQHSRPALADGATD